MKLVPIKEAMKEMSLSRNTIMAFCKEHPECIYRFGQVKGNRGAIRIDMDAVETVLKASKRC